MLFAPTLPGVAHGLLRTGALGIWAPAFIDPRTIATTHAACLFLRTSPFLGEAAAAVEQASCTTRREPSTCQMHKPASDVGMSVALFRFYKRTRVTICKPTRQGSVLDFRLFRLRDSGPALTLAVWHVR